MIMGTPLSIGRDGFSFSAPAHFTLNAISESSLLIDSSPHELTSIMEET